MHNIESLFSVRQVPWHGLGTIIQEAPTSEDAIRIAGLDWKVMQDDVYMSNGEKIPGYKLNYRDKDGKPLGIVSPRYRIVQNADAFAFTDALLGEGVTYETAGSLASGKRVWMLAKTDRVQIAEEDIDPYLVFTNCHDGTGSVKVAITPIRVVCQNTLNLALRAASRQWSCQHLGDIDSKLAEAEMTLLNTRHYMEALEKEVGVLKLQKMDVDKVKEAIDELFPISLADYHTNKGKNLLAIREEAMDRYLYAPDLKDTEKTAFRFVNAISDLATHKEPFRRTKNYQENMFIKTADGNNIIDMAYRLVKSA